MQKSSQKLNRKSIGNTSTKKSKSNISKLKPLLINEELEEVTNPLIKIIVYIEVCITNIFIYSVKLFTDLPRLLSYSTPYDKYIISKNVLIYSIIYLIIYQLSLRFNYKSPIFIKPILPVYTSYFTFILSLIGYIVCLKNKGDKSTSNDFEEYNNDNNSSNTDNYIEDTDEEDNDIDDWGTSELPTEYIKTSSIKDTMNIKHKTTKKTTKEKDIKETDIKDIELPTKPNLSSILDTKITKESVENLDSEYVEGGNIFSSLINSEEDNIPLVEENINIPLEQDYTPNINLLDILKDNSIFPNNTLDNTEDSDDDDDDVTIM